MATTSTDDKNITVESSTAISRSQRTFWQRNNHSESQCREWFARFKSCDTSLEDKPGRGRPSDFDDQALLAAVDEDESLTTRMLAEDFNVNQSTVVHRFKKFGKVGKIAGWIPTSSPTTTESITFEFSPSYCSETNKHRLGSASTSAIFSKRSTYGLSRQPLFEKLANKIYDDLDDLVADVKALIASKNRVFFARGINRLPSKWEAVIEVDGDYTPE
ncbi:histone-lysine N-methyltransferase SETMAR [Trichonephila clavipes]|nr:histone-lysine N-methyltransferase SETMAR [Trichonephila clavipes]